MRIQFNVTNLELKQIERRAQEEGYPDISTFCKDLVLQQKTYKILWETVKKKIENMTEDDPPFVLRDLIETPPAYLGVLLYKKQKELNISVVEKDNAKTNIYIKNKEDTNK